KYCGSELPAQPAAFTRPDSPEQWQQEARDVRETILAGCKRFEAEFEVYNFSRALEAVWEVIGRVDKYISDSAPWNLAKDSSRREQVETILFTSLEALRYITVMLTPVMPEACATIWTQLGLDGDPSDVNPETLKWGELPASKHIPEIKALFPTIDKESL